MPEEEQPHASRGVTLRAIAVFKLVKATLLVVVGLGALSMTKKSVAIVAARWLSAFALKGGERFVSRFAAWLSEARPSRLGVVGIVAFVYAALYATEGTGLWLKKRWAEYLTVVATGSFVPFEIYELAERFTAVRVSALVINVAVFAYLVYHLRKTLREERSKAASPAPSEES